MRSSAASLRTGFSHSRVSPVRDRAGPTPCTLVRRDTQPDAGHHRAAESDQRRVADARPNRGMTTHATTTLTLTGIGGTVACNDNFAAED